MAEGVKDRCPKCGGGCSIAGSATMTFGGGQRAPVWILRCDACGHQFAGPPRKEASRRRR
jgi:hypothetical protein